MRQMREAFPIVWWKAMCYHYVRRTRQVTRYRNGDAFTTTQVYYERVNSHTAGCAFNFTNCGVKDASKCITGLEDYPATKIRFTKSYSFANEDAFYEYEGQRNQFFQENERRDDYMETREGMDLLNVNFKEYMIAFKDPDNLPWYVSHVIFWIASCLMLSWPLRVIIEYKTAYIHYHVQKVFGTNYAEARQHGRGNIPRDNTVASVDLEMNIRNNFTVVPSYSEALLMDANATSTHTLRDANANVTSPVLGPTRSVTWNNLTTSSSTGHVSGFFTASNTPKMPHSYTTANGELMTQAQTGDSNSLSNSIKSILQSPWNRKRKRIQNRQTQQKMFMLTSPDSPDDFEVTLDQRLSSANFAQHTSSNNGARSKESSSLSADLDRMNQSSHSVVTKGKNKQTPSTIDEMVRAAVAKESEPLPDADNTREISASNVMPGPCKSNRPSSISNVDTLPSLGASSVVSDVRTIKGILPKVNVQISNIIPDSPSYEALSNSTEHVHLPNSVSQINTPSSPPCYEDALGMQAPSLATASNHSDISERTRLYDGYQRRSRSYRAIMETSL